MKRLVAKCNRFSKECFGEPSVPKESLDQNQFKHFLDRGRVGPDLRKADVRPLRILRPMGRRGRPYCREWMFWLLHHGLLESSQAPFGRSGLYTDFT